MMGCLLETPSCCSSAPRRPRVRAAGAIPAGVAAAHAASRAAVVRAACHLVGQLCTWVQKATNRLPRASLRIPGRRGAAGRCARREGFSCGAAVPRIAALAASGAPSLRAAGAFGLNERHCCMYTMPVDHPASPRIYNVRFQPVRAQGSAALSTLGLALVVVPRFFIDDLVDANYLQLPSLLKAADASAQLHPKHIAAIGKVQLITCRCASCWHACVYACGRLHAARVRDCARVLSARLPAVQAPHGPAGRATPHGRGVAPVPAQQTYTDRGARAKGCAGVPDTRVPRDAGGSDQLGGRGVEGGELVGRRDKWSLCAGVCVARSPAARRAPLVGRCRTQEGEVMPSLMV